MKLSKVYKAPSYKPSAWLQSRSSYDSPGGFFCSNPYTVDKKVTRLREVERPSQRLGLLQSPGSVPTLSRFLHRKRGKRRSRCKTSLRGLGWVGPSSFSRETLISAFQNQGPIDSGPRRLRALRGWAACKVRGVDQSRECAFFLLYTSDGDHREQSLSLGCPPANKDGDRQVKTEGVWPGAHSEPNYRKSRQVSYWGGL